jgi:MFS family permease
MHRASRFGGSQVGESVQIQAPGFLTALRVRDYRLVWISSFLSSSAYWGLLIGRNWLVLNLSHSAGWVGLATFANMVPFFLATPLGGLLSDRIDRRKLVVVAQGFSLLSALGLAVLLLAGVIEPWQVVAFSFLNGCARAIETPAAAAIIPNLVRKEFLLNAIALASVATFGSRLFGSLAGGGLQGWLSTSSLFLFVAALWLLAMGFMLPVRASMEYLNEHVGKRGGNWRQTLQTLRYVASTPMISLVFLIVALHCALTMSVDAVEPTFVKQALHGGSGVYSLIVMAFGAGSLVGTFALAGMQSSASKGRLLLITGIGSGVSTALLGISPVAVTALFASALMGATQGMFMAIANTLVQEVVPDRLRGRVSSAYLMVTGGVMSFANLGGGYLADRVGVQAVLIVPAAGFVLLLLVISGVRPNLRQIYRTGTLEAVQTAA